MQAISTAQVVTHEQLAEENAYLKKRVEQLACELARVRFFLREAQGKPRSNDDRQGDDLRLVEFRAIVLERDRHTCRDCGSKSVVTVHHIMMWAYHPELRYDPANGVALCEACHHRRHAVNHWRSKDFDPNRPI